MVKATFLLVCLLFSFSLNAQAEAARSLVWGESFTLSLTSSNLQQDYSQLDLSPLQNDFYIDDRAQTSAGIRLRLTPLRPGVFELPNMKSGELRIAQQKIQVHENPEVNLIWNPMKQEYWQHQTANQRATLSLRNPNLTVQMYAEPRDDVTYSAQPISQILAQDKTLEFVHSQILAAQDFQPTLQSLQQPVIQVQNPQGGRWLFYAPQRKIMVNPIPHYLPADIAIGQLELQIDRPFWHKLGQLHYQTFRLQGQHTHRLPNLAPLLLDSNSPYFETLQPNIERHSMLTKNGLELQQIFTQPYRINQLGSHLGYGQFEEVRLTLFNPKSGKLETLILPAQAYWVLPAWVYHLGGIIALLLAGLVLIALIKQARIILIWLIWQWQLKQAQTPLQQWQAYQRWAQARGLGFCPTQQAWLNAYDQKFGQSESYQKHLQRITQALYRKP